MICNKCGFQNNDNDRFCKNCGFLMSHNVEMKDNLKNDIEKETNNNADKMIDGNKDKYAIWSVLIGIGGIICSIFIGMSLLWAIILSGIGFNFSSRGKQENPFLANVGIVLNGLVLGYGILVFVMILIERM